MPHWERRKKGSREHRYVRTADNVYRVLKMLDIRHLHAPPDSLLNAGVNLIEHSTTGMLYVQKRLKLSDEAFRLRTSAEINALKQIRRAGASRNVNKIKEYFYHDTPEICSLIIEYCDKGTVDDVIDRYYRAGRTVSEDFLWHILSGLANALCFTHYGLDPSRHSIDEGFPSGWNTITHLDIKPANVFLTTTDQHGPFPRVVLGDFGCVITRHDIDAGKQRLGHLRFGTPGWHPPELVETDAGWEGIYGRRTDIWQMGAVVQVLCTLSQLPSMRLIDKGTPCGKSSRYSPGLHKMVSRCMAHRASKRPTAFELVKKLRALGEAE